MRPPPPPRSFNDFENSDDWGLVNKVIKDDPDQQNRGTPGSAAENSNQFGGGVAMPGAGAKKKVGPGRPRRG